MKKVLLGLGIFFILTSVVLLVSLKLKNREPGSVGSRTQDSGWQKILLATTITSQLDDDVVQIDLQGANIINGGSISTTGTATSTISGPIILSQAQFGPLNFVPDSGIQSWVDISVTTASANNVTTSYTAQIDGVKFLTIAAQSNGSGGIKNHNFKFGRANSSTIIYVGTADGCSAYIYAVSTTNPTPTATSTANCN